LTEKRRTGEPSRISVISVEPPPMSMFISDECGAAHPREAASPTSRASSTPGSISTRTPA
jgi:hypothetical protein